MMPGDSIKKMIGFVIPEEEIGELDSLTGDALKEKLQEFSGMRMEMFFKGPSVSDQGKAAVNKAHDQINSLESILVNIGGRKQELRPQETPGIEEIRKLVDRLRSEGLSIYEISKDYAVFGKSPFDNDIDPATLKVMADRMSADVVRYRQARMEFEGEGPGKDAPDNDLSPAGASPVPGMNMRPGV